MKMSKEPPWVWFIPLPLKKKKKTSSFVLRSNQVMTHTSCSNMNKGKKLTVTRRKQTMVGQRAQMEKKKNSNQTRILTRSDLFQMHWLGCRVGYPTEIPKHLHQNNLEYNDERNIDLARLSSEETANTSKGAFFKALCKQVNQVLVRATTRRHTENVWEP